MRKLVLLIITLIALILSSSSLWAKDVDSLWDGRTIKGIHTYKNQIVILFHDYGNSIDGCRTNQAYINSNSDNYDQVLTIALSACQSRSEYVIKLPV